MPLLPVVKPFLSKKSENPFLIYINKYIYKKI